MTTEIGVCAVCGSDDIEYGPITDDGNDYVYYPITCNECGARSEERYDLEYIGTYPKHTMKETPR